MPRTREQDRERYSNGRAKPIGPTHETAKKHAERAARYHIPAGKEAGFAESTIGILEARGMISIDQAELMKKLANLHSILFGSGRPKALSTESVGRATRVNESETRWMRDTWAAYKNVTASWPGETKHLFEHVILRNNYREWMRLDDNALVSTHSEVGGECVADNVFRAAGVQVTIRARYREPSLILRGISSLTAGMARRSGEVKHTELSQSQRNALAGDGKLCDLYANSGART